MMSTLSFEEGEFVDFIRDNGPLYLGMPKVYPHFLVNAVIIEKYNDGTYDVVYQNCRYCSVSPERIVKKDGLIDPLFAEYKRREGKSGRMIR